MLSISFIIANFSNFSGWEGVAERHLSDGTRLVATALGDGFRIYRKGILCPVYVPFS